MGGGAASFPGRVGGKHFSLLPRGLGMRLGGGGALCRGGRGECGINVCGVGGENVG